MNYKIEEYKDNIKEDLKQYAKDNAGYFKTLDEVAFYIVPIIEFLATHNKNYTQEQYHKMQILADLAKAFERASK